METTYLIYLFIYLFMREKSRSILQMFERITVTYENVTTYLNLVNFSKQIKTSLRAHGSFKANTAGGNVVSFVLFFQFSSKVYC